MKQKVLFSILLLSILSSAAFAQKNRIQLYMGGYKMYNVLGYEKTVKSTVGLSVSREITEKLAVELGYYFPNVGGIQVQGMGRRLYEKEMLDSYDDIGKLLYREYYHYFDFGVRYKLLSLKHQSLSVKQSFSVAYGTNMYLSNVGAIETENDPFHVLFTAYDEKKEIQLGGVTGLSYDYSLWKNRINVGVDFVARYYTKSFPFQLNYGLHLGYNL